MFCKHRAVRQPHFRHEHVRQDKVVSMCPSPARPLQLLQSHISIFRNVNCIRVLFSGANGVTRMLTLWRKYSTSRQSRNTHHQNHTASSHASTLCV